MLRSWIIGLGFVAAGPSRAQDDSAPAAAGASYYIQE